jgi:molybdopterin-binding protein
MHVTHDYEEAVTLASKVAVLHEGQIIQSGATQEVFHHPKSEFIANFMGVKNFFEARVEELIQDDGTTLPIGRITNTIRLILQPQASCGNGFLMIRGEDITLSNSRYESSAVNNFEGIVTEIVHGPNGMEITVDTGIPLTAIITGGSLAQLGLREGKSIWLAIKASAVRFIPG